jgi:hypothetical protein
MARASLQIAGVVIFFAGLSACEDNGTLVRVVLSLSESFGTGTSRPDRVTIEVDGRRGHDQTNVPEQPEAGRKLGYWLGRWVGAHETVPIVEIAYQSSNEVGRASGYWSVGPDFDMPIAPSAQGGASGDGGGGAGGGGMGGMGGMGGAGGDDGGAGGNGGGAGGAGGSAGSGGTGADAGMDASGGAGGTVDGGADAPDGGPDPCIGYCMAMANKCPFIYPHNDCLDTCHGFHWPTGSPGGEDNSIQCRIDHIPFDCRYAGAMGGCSTLQICGQLCPPAGPCGAYCDALTQNCAGTGGDADNVQSCLADCMTFKWEDDGKLVSSGPKGECFMYWAGFAARASSDKQADCHKAVVGSTACQ